MTRKLRDDLEARAGGSVGRRHAHGHTSQHERHRRAILAGVVGDGDGFGERGGGLRRFGDRSGIGIVGEIVARKIVNRDRGSGDDDLAMDDDISAVGDPDCLVEVLLRHQDSEIVALLELLDLVDRPTDQQWRQADRGLVDQQDAVQEVQRPATPTAPDAFQSVREAADADRIVSLVGLSFGFGVGLAALALLLRTYSTKVVPKVDHVVRERSGLFQFFVGACDAVVLFVLAAFVEGFISASALPYVFKLGVAILSALLMACYLLLCGRGESLGGVPAQAS